MEQLGKHFKKIAGAALTRHGFAYADLLAHWPDILGPELSRHCLPEKLSFPRDPSGTAKTGGTLTLRARYGRALDVQYSAPAIIERVNAYCGYNVVVALKVLQGALPEPAAPPPARPTTCPTRSGGCPAGKTRSRACRIGRWPTQGCAIAAGSWCDGFQKTPAGAVNRFDSVA